MQGREQPGWWCADNDALCPRIWWCSAGSYVAATIVGCLLWTCSFVALVKLVYPRVRSLAELWPSKYKEESGPTWFAWHVQSTLHACCVCSMSALATAKLSRADPLQQLGAPSLRAEEGLLDAIASVANGSHVFFCYIIVDTAVTFYRKAMTLDYFAHHVVFIMFCVLIQFDCFAPFVAGVLLMMETSTIFLNGFSYFRHRLGYEHWFVKASFVLFAFSFLLCRLVGTTYVTCYFGLSLLRSQLDAVGVPRWHLHVVCVGLVSAVLLQGFWAVTITRKLARVVSARPELAHAPADGRSVEARGAEEELQDGNGERGVKDKRS